MEGINFREAAKEDLDELVDCWEEFMDFNLRSVEGSKRREWMKLTGDASEKSCSHFEDEIEEEDKFVLLAENDEGIVGYIVASLEDRPPIFEGEKLGKIDELFVEEKHREEGIGNSLVERAVEWLKGKEIDLLKVRILQSNETADEFWDSRGFKDHIKIKFKEPD